MTVTTPHHQQHKQDVAREEAAMKPGAATAVPNHVKFKACDTDLVTT